MAEDQDMTDRELRAIHEYLSAILQPRARD
jgi:hypothetical protein